MNDQWGVKHRPKGLLQESRRYDKQGIYNQIIERA
jgi:hypothetical protein